VAVMEQLSYTVKSSIQQYILVQKEAGPPRLHTHPVRSLLQNEFSVGVFMGHHKLTCGTHVACSWTTLVYLHTIARYRMWLQSLQNDCIANIPTHLQVKERGHMQSSAFSIQTPPSNGAATGRNGSCVTVSTAVTLLVTFPVPCSLSPSHVHLNCRAPKVITFFATNCWRHSAW